MRFELQAAAIFFLCSLLGCADKGPALIPINGKISFAGGPPPAAGRVTFTPVSDGSGGQARPGTGHFDRDGVFHVTSFKKDDGLLPGKYQANVICTTAQLTDSDPNAAEQYDIVPKNFMPPPITVDAKSPGVQVEIDVPKKK
ncbi:MAG TPA: hypothetical protein VHU84_14850 [Lacipirellulaceae bacterium]|jgi:hypothetical protein|nr:hypothetical protein [Lacipirellulaceae bacterium]